MSEYQGWKEWGHRCTGEQFLEVGVKHCDGWDRADTLNHIFTARTVLLSSTDITAQNCWECLRPFAALQLWKKGEKSTHALRVFFCNFYILCSCEHLWLHEVLLVLLLDWAYFLLNKRQWKERRILLSHWCIPIPLSCSTTQFWLLFNISFWSTVLFLMFLGDLKWMMWEPSKCKIRHIICKKQNLGEKYIEVR